MRSSALLAFIFLTNLFFSQTYTLEEKAALLNITGINVSNVAMNERNFQKAKTHFLKTSPDVLILGSSRVLKITGDVVGKPNTLNVGMSGAVLEDLIAVYYCFRVRGLKPKEVIIGIDPWMLNQEDTRWWALTDEFNAMKQMLIHHTPFPIKNETPAADIKFGDICSATFFEFTSANFTANDTLKKIVGRITNDLRLKELVKKDTIAFLNEMLKKVFLYDSLKNKPEMVLNTTGNNLVLETNVYRKKKSFDSLTMLQAYNVVKLNRIILELMYECPASNMDDLIPTLSDENVPETILTNGSYVYDHNFEAVNPGRIKLMITAYKTYKLQKNQTMNDSSKVLFEKFIDHLLAEQIKVSFVLVPYHADIHKFFVTTKEYSFPLRFETYIKTFAKKKNIPVYGSYNPKPYLIESNDFYDGMHIRPSGLKKLKLK
jgi:hypothetical protein